MQASTPGPSAVNPLQRDLGARASPKASPLTTAAFEQEPGAQGTGHGARGTQGTGHRTRAHGAWSTKHTGHGSWGTGHGAQGTQGMEHTGHRAWGMGHTGHGAWGTWGMGYMGHGAQGMEHGTYGARGTGHGAWGARGMGHGAQGMGHGTHGAWGMEHGAHGAPGTGQIQPGENHSWPAPHPHVVTKGRCCPGGQEPRTVRRGKSWPSGATYLAHSFSNSRGVRGTSKPYSAFFRSRRRRMPLPSLSVSMKFCNVRRRH